MGRVEFEGLVEGAGRLLVLTGFPCRQTEHVIAPGVVRVGSGISGKQLGGFGVAAGAEGRFGSCIRDGRHHRRSHGRRLGTGGCGNGGRIRLGRHCRLIRAVTRGRDRDQGRKNEQR
jgi:hypothetical protein